MQTAAVMKKGAWPREMVLALVLVFVVVSLAGLGLDRRAMLALQSTFVHTSSFAISLMGWSSWSPSRTPRRPKNTRDIPTTPKQQGRSHAPPSLDNRQSQLVFVPVHLVVSCGSVDLGVRVLAENNGSFKSQVLEIVFTEAWMY